MLDCIIKQNDSQQMWKCPFSLWISKEFPGGQFAGNWCPAWSWGIGPLFPGQERWRLRSHVEHAGRKGRRKTSISLNKNLILTFLKKIKRNILLKSIQQLECNRSLLFYRNFQPIWMISSCQQIVKLHKIFTLLASRRGVLTGPFRFVLLTPVIITNARGCLDAL